MNKEPVSPSTPPSPQPIEGSGNGLSVKNKPVRRFKKLTIIAGSILIVLLGIVFTGWLWYQSELAPMKAGSSELIKVTIEPNTTPSAIGKLLEEKDVIRSSRAFGLYTRLSGTQNILQAGSYRLSPGESTPEIVEHLTNGNTDTFDITFLPGSTLAQNRTVLIEAGYSESEVDAALSASYSSPLFAGKPVGSDLEGYIYGETYKFGSDTSVEAILTHIFDTYYQVIESNGLVAKFQSHGLSLYEGITLASIIQREASGGDEAQIAQVFYSRLEMGMVLGSDVTYQYIADKTGVARDPNLDSPYNTRRFPGLPPGPISVPGLASLKAVGNPAEGDYLFFLSGDDDVTYFARTNEEHERNIVEHCQKKCSIL